MGFCVHHRTATWMVAFAWRGGRFCLFKQCLHERTIDARCMVNSLDGFMTCIVWRISSAVGVSNFVNGGICCMAFTSPLFVRVSLTCLIFGGQGRDEDYPCCDGQDLCIDLVNEISHDGVHWSTVILFSLGSGRIRDVKSRKDGGGSGVRDGRWCRTELVRSFTQCMPLSCG